MKGRAAQDGGQVFAVAALKKSALARLRLHEASDQGRQEGRRREGRAAQDSGQVHAKQGGAQPQASDQGRQERDLRICTTRCIHTARH